MKRRLGLAALLAFAASAQPPPPQMGPLSATLGLGQVTGMRGGRGADGSYIWQIGTGAYRFQSLPVTAPDYLLRVRLMTDIGFDEQRVNGAGLVFGATADAQEFWALVVAGNQLRVVRRERGLLTVPLSTASAALNTMEWTELEVTVSDGSTVAITLNGQALVSFEAAAGTLAGGAGIFIGGAGTARYIHYDQR